MQLTGSQKRDLIAKLSQVWTNRVCPACGQIGWDISDRIFEVRSFAKGAIGSGPVQPLVSVVCNQCGYTHLFNAITLGVIQQAENVDDSDEEGSNRRFDSFQASK